MVNVCRGVCQNSSVRTSQSCPWLWLWAGWDGHKEAQNSCAGWARILEPNLHGEPGGCSLGLKGESLKGDSWQASLMGKCDTKSGKPKIVAGLFVIPPWNYKK